MASTRADTTTAWTTRRRTRSGMGRTGTLRSRCAGTAIIWRIARATSRRRTRSPRPRAPPALKTALQQEALERSGILLQANVARPHGPTGEATVDLLVDASSVTFTTGADGLRHAKLLLLLSAATPSGPAGPEKQAVLNLGLESADYQTVLAKGVPVRQTLTGVPAGATLQLAVRDLQTGQTGTLRLQ